MQYKMEGPQRYIEGGDTIKKWVSHRADEKMKVICTLVLPWSPTLKKMQVQLRGIQRQQRQWHQ